MVIINEKLCVLHKILDHVILEHLIKIYSYNFILILFFCKMFIYQVQMLANLLDVMCKISQMF